MSEILNLTPKALWKHFYALTQIPRPSKKEGKAIDFVEKFGKDLGLETIRDEVGNVMIRKPATPGMENRKGVVLQGHVDMVPQKNSDKNHDFEKDPIEAFVDGDWVTANGTTLGADNGMGVAAAMAVLEANDLEHPMVEALFTMDEETGMTGAKALKPNILKGDILINMDSEDEGELYVGCAGGIDINVAHKFAAEKNSMNKAFNIHIKGLKGGHSGLDINIGRANANKLLFRALKAVGTGADFRLASVAGGDLRNAITREAVAVVTVSADKADGFKSSIEDAVAKFREEYKAAENSIAVDVSEVDNPTNVLSEADHNALVDAVLETVHGVVKMSESMEGLVETSTNLAIVKLADGALEVNCLTRSADDDAKMVFANKMKAIWDNLGCDVKLEGEYPGWKPNMDSEILQTMQSSYESLYGVIPEIKAIHAGLECGILGGAYPNWDMISFGPTIRYPHSPDEKVNIETVEKFWKWLVETLKNVPTK
ncbi:MAG: aminoacyl-histidine dipeptidase [Bacteroidota bacterium]|nr:aminoacyl-histidine dipeptidase [Bacteroidota bacterium]